MRFALFVALFSAAVLAGCAQTAARQEHTKPLSPSPPAGDFQERSTPCRQTGEQVTLSEAFALTLLHNPELAAFSWEVRAAEADALQAPLGPNPELELEVEEAAGSGPRRGFDAAETTIRLSQLIETAGKPAKRRAAATLAADLADWQYRSTRMLVLADTSRAFIEVLSAQRSLKSTQDLLDLATRQLEAVTTRVETGKDLPIEQNKAEIVLSKARVRFTQAQQQLLNARRQLASFWASKEPVFKEAVGNLTDIRPLQDFQQAAAQLAKNPDLARWATAIDHAKAVEELERANGKQDFTLSAGVQRFNETDDSAVVFGISIPLPLFDRNQGGIAAARYRTRKTEQLHKAAEANLYAALSQAWAAFNSAHAEVAEFESNLLTNAKRAFEIAQETYRQGKTDFLDVLDAQRTFFETQTEYIQALTACHLARIEVDRLTGGLTETATLSKE